MYNTEEAWELGHWFSDTCIEYNGQLVYIHRFLEDGRCMFIRDDREDTITLNEQAINWSPRIPSGYYNLKDNTYWLSLCGRRQYKVGINSESVRGRLTSIGSLGGEFRVSNGIILEAYNGGASFPITRDVMQAKLDAWQCVGLTEELGIHSYPHSDVALLVRNAAHAVGLYTDGTAYLETGTTLSVPSYLRTEYVSSQDLLAAFAAGS